MPPQRRQDHLSFTAPAPPRSDDLLWRILRYPMVLDFALAPSAPSRLQCNPTPVRRSAPLKKSIKPPIPECTSVKARSKKTIPLILKDAKHNPSLTCSRKQTYRPSIKGPIILVTDHSKILKPIPLASQVLGMEMTNIDESESLEYGSLIEDN